MYKLIITTEEEDQAEQISDLLAGAEEECDLNFPFNVELIEVVTC